MTEPALAPLEALLPEVGTQLDADELLSRFLRYTEGQGLQMYPAQEEAILELLAGHNVILNTPTGSGKSLVALAACFKALAEGKFAFYTAPIKALVTEKFFELCKLLGPRNVGMMTGDATVNRDAPILCCTAEILANVALREGAAAQADWVVMDEFHYYSDKDRGVAWQLPLLTLPRARFLLMSATLGKPEFFVGELQRRTGAGAALVRSTERPVPLDFTYSEEPLQDTVTELVEAGKAPVYIVHFSQRAASEQAQNLMSLNFTDKEDKRRIKEELAGFRFDSPFGKELARFIPHGIGVHHAGMLPKYRRLNERLAQAGLLRIICGTDTLGVGVNVPIRTVLFTQLCKFDGESVVLLPARDFHQIAGRAGRRGFDTAGSVVVQAPEHEIENKVLKQRAEGNAKKQKKLRLKKPPERGYKPWNAETLQRLREAEPEPLVSRFSVNHGLLLNALAGPDGCRGARRIIRECHETPARKRALMREGLQLFGSLVSSGIVEVQGRKVTIHSDLQQDFSLNQALSLYAVEAFEAVDLEVAGHGLILLSILEATLESPAVVLHRQEATLRSRLVAELKAEGVEYEQRMEELEKVEYPKPEADTIYETFNLFAKHHPWVAGHNIAPKSIVRSMIEESASFNVYVKDYGLARAEGVLLRYMTDCYRALQRTVPEKLKTDEVLDIEDWLGAELRRVDASLLDEWERLESGDTSPEQPGGQAEERSDDITRDKRALRALVRNLAFRIVQALAARSYARAIEALADAAPSEAAFPTDGHGEIWTEARLEAAVGPYWKQYDRILVDADARGGKRLSISQSADALTIVQTISDPEENHDWSLSLVVDLKATAQRGSICAALTELGEA